MMDGIKNHRKVNIRKRIKKLFYSLIVTTVLFFLVLSTSQSFAADYADLDERYTIGVNLSWVYVTSGNETATLAYMQKSDGTAIGPVYCIDKTITASTVTGAYDAMLAQQDVVNSYKNFKYDYHGYEATVVVEKILWIVRNGFSAEGKPTAGGKTGTISDPSAVSWANNNIDDLKNRFNIDTLYVPEAYQATQLALWYYSDPDETVQESLQLHKLKPNVRALYDALVAGAEAAADPNSESKPPLIPEISIDLDFESSEYNSETGYFGPVTVSIEQNPYGFTGANDIQITIEVGTGIEIIDNPSGAVIETSMKNGQSFYIDAGKTQITDKMELLTINASVNKSSEISDAFMFSAPNMNWAKQQTLIAAITYKNAIDICDSVKIMVSDFEITQDDSASLLITNEVHGIDDMSEILGDAAVQIEGKNDFDEVIVKEEVPLDSFKDGEYLLDNLPPGNYTVTMNGEDVDGYSHTVNPSPATVSLNSGDSMTIDIVITYTSKSNPTTFTTSGTTPAAVSNSTPVTRDNADINMWVALLVSSILVLAVSIRVKIVFSENRRFKFRTASN